MRHGAIVDNVVMYAKFDDDRFWNKNNLSTNNNKKKNVDPGLVHGSKKRTANSFCEDNWWK